MYWTKLGFRLYLDKIRQLLSSVRNLLFLGIQVVVTQS